MATDTVPTVPTVPTAAMTIDQARALLAKANADAARALAFDELNAINGAIKARVDAGKRPNASPATIATAERLASVVPIGEALAKAFENAANEDKRLMAMVQAFKGLAK